MYIMSMRGVKQEARSFSHTFDYSAEDKKEQKKGRMQQEQERWKGVMGRHFSCSRRRHGISQSISAQDFLSTTDDDTIVLK